VRTWIADRFFVALDSSIVRSLAHLPDVRQCPPRVFDETITEEHGREEIPGVFAA
jgi:hypothetical protein